MFHVEDDKIKALILKGNFGLEKESLRITQDGYMAHTGHPFVGDKHIVRDFSENQIEINTSVESTAEDAVASLYRYTVKIQKKLAENGELLWPFSSPPYIRNENDIPIAFFEEPYSSQVKYREYLSDRYGRYKMSFSGIHVNYSFSDELLEADFALSSYSDFQKYKNDLYLVLAERAASYSWILTAVTAASPYLDSSFVEKGVYGKNSFNGMASTRCSELGYWNYFTPIFDYSSLEAYCDKIEWFVKQELIVSPSELYYPVRIKPKGVNSLERLKHDGVDHIELRMFDLNPLCKEGIDIRDLKFAQLLLVYLASSPRQTYEQKDQVNSSQNFKNAAHYDLQTVKISIPDNTALSVVDAGREVIGFLREFYQGFPQEIQDILDYEEAKFINPELRYAWQVRKLYSDGFVSGGLELAKKYQEMAIKDV
ncbi:MAG: hypothetical protein Q4C49_01830 [Bacillota bacterium]|nr:hypothetical protein [Bacillota bacterium]